MKKAYVAMLVCMLLSIATPVLGIHWDANGGISHNTLLLHSEVEWGRISFMWWNDAHTETPSAEIRSDVDISVGQTVVGLGYVFDFDLTSISLKTKLGIRYLYHKREGGLFHYIDKEKVFVPTVFLEENKFMPYGMIEAILNKSPILLSVGAGVSDKGIDGRLTATYEINERISLNLGYWYWPMDKWYRGVLFGLGMNI